MKNYISNAVGSFDSVTGVTSENGTGPYPGANSFTLQLNSNFFTSPACNGTAGCLGWQQFVYSNVACPNCAYMQYWLLNYNGTCPENWYSYSGDCYTNSNAVSVPPQTIANLGNMSMQGNAVSGSMDTLIFSTGSALYAVQGPDAMVSLSTGWQDAEFNIFGDCCSAQANFNTGSTLVVRTSVDAGTPAAPGCYAGGYTGETNNLSFASAPAAQKGTSSAVVFTESTGGSASACSSATTLASGVLTDTHDFNANGNSDILWLNTGGGLAMWAMKGSTVAQSWAVGAVGPWSIVGQRDFNGDGKADILWLDTSGNLALWFMDGPTVVQSSGIGKVSGSWSIADTGDFNGDGFSDILWRDTSGNLAIWEMNGASVATSCGLGNAAAHWTIVGVGDFDGDGNSDIAWQDSNSGDLAIWFMNGCAVKSSSVIGVVTGTWSVAGIGDFNGDGYSDFLWRDGSGNLAIWEMRGATIYGSLGVGNASTIWSVAQIGDYYGAGTSDILWHDTSGNVAVWQMNGATVVQSAGIANAPPSVWTIQSAGAK